MAWEDDAACWEKVLKHFFMMMSRKKNDRQKTFPTPSFIPFNRFCCFLWIKFYFTTNSERKIKLLFIFLVWLMRFMFTKALTLTLQSSRAFSSDIAFLSVIACVILMSFNGQLSFWLYLSASLLSEFCEHFLKLFYALKIEFFFIFAIWIKRIKSFLSYFIFFDWIFMHQSHIDCDKIKIYAISPIWLIIAVFSF